jgi:hypothetical protein
MEIISTVYTKDVEPKNDFHPSPVIGVFVFVVFEPR